MHYKIKDDVDLSVLEEYGYDFFEYAGGVKNYAKETSDVVVCVLFDREIVLYILPYRVCYLEEQNKHYIKDLIDAGLVEEANND